MIRMTQDAKILYDIEVPIGTQKIPFKFTIALEEQVIDEKARLLKQIEKLEKRVRKLEESKIEETDLPSIEFDSLAPQASFFTFSNSGRTIMAKTSNSWRGIFAKNPLPKQRKSSFSVRIDYTDSNRNIFIGICPSNLKNNQYYYSYNGSFAYYANSNGHVYQNGGQSQHLQFSGGVPGTIIKVETDLIKNEVSFYYNEERCHTSKLDASIVQSYDYFPFVDLHANYDRVSFVSFKIEP